LRRYFAIFAILLLIQLQHVFNSFQTTFLSNDFWIKLKKPFVMSELLGNLPHFFPSSDFFLVNLSIE